MKYYCDKFIEVVNGDIKNIREKPTVARNNEDKSKWTVYFGYAEVFTIEYCPFCGKKLTGEYNDRRK